MAEQNFSAALSTWKGEQEADCHLLELIVRNKPFGATEVARLDSARAGRESKGEHGWQEEAS